MSAFDTLSMALKNLYKRKLRTFLTVLGVIVGSCAIIIMISLGLAINKSFEDRMMTTPNATTIMIYNWEVYNGQDKVSPAVDDAALAKIAQIPDVEAVTPWLNNYVAVKAGRYSAEVQIIGVIPEALPAMGITLQEGQFLQSKDEWGMMFGSAVAQNFMTARERNNWYMQMNRDPNAKPKVDLMNDRLQASADYSFGMETNTPVEEGYEGYEGESQNAQPPVKPHNVNAVAIMAPGDDYETTSAAFMNIKTVQLLMKEREEMWGRQAREYNGYEVTRIKATTVAAVENITAALQDMGFSENIIQTPTSYISELKGTMASLQTLLGAMGIISLFIATIGISNTMVMSTVERTREIGVMKVIGASLRDIRKLFLLEAAIIGFLGGLLGVGVSYIASFILNNNGQSLFAFMDAYSYYGEMMSSDVSIIPIWLSAASLGFAAIIGLIAGFFPAQRATTISALSAIRAE